MRKIFGLIVAELFAVSTAIYAAQVTLPDTSQTTTFTANVSEQAVVSVPASITFNVTDVSSDTQATSDATVSATTIVLADGNALKVEIKANAASFTAPTGGSVTWSASDVSWDAATWTNGTGSSGQLSSAAYTQVAVSEANASSLSTSDLTFTLAAKSTVDRAGNHTLVATWKFSSFTP
jgi:hypothetical protein